MKKRIFFLILIALSFSCISCHNKNKTIEDNKPEIPKDSVVDDTLTLSFVGDIMTNPNLVKAFENRDELDSLKPYLRGDIVFANLEFGLNEDRPPMPYPCFNGSKDYLLYFTNYFNTFSIANNHAFDQGAKAESKMMSLLQLHHIQLLGGSSDSSYIQPFLKKIKGINVFLGAYTMVDNGLSSHNHQKDYRYYMNYFPTSRLLLAKVQQDLKNLPDSTLKIISLHFGQEYKTIPEPSNIKLARDLIESGVDVIIGQHPHVPRPVEIYKGKRHSGIIMYSFGNFISFHKSSYNYLDVSAIVNMMVNKKLEVSFKFVPTYYTFIKKHNDTFFKIRPVLSDSINKILLPDSLSYSDNDIQKMKKGYQLIHQFYAPLVSDSVRYLFKNGLKKQERTR